MPCWERVSGRGETNVLSQERGYALSTCAAQTPERARCITDAVCGNYDYNEGRPITWAYDRHTVPCPYLAFQHASCLEMESKGEILSA